MTHIQVYYHRQFVKKSFASGNWLLEIMRIPSTCETLAVQLGVRVRIVKTPVFLYSTYFFVAKGFRNWLSVY